MYFKLFYFLNTIFELSLIYSVSNLINLKKFYHFNFYGKTALHRAVEKENFEIIQLLLLNKEISVNITDEIFY